MYQIILDIKKKFNSIILSLIKNNKVKLIVNRKLKVIYLINKL